MITRSSAATASLASRSSAARISAAVAGPLTATSSGIAVLGRGEASTVISCSATPSLSRIIRWTATTSLTQPASGRSG